MRETRFGLLAASGPPWKLPGPRGEVRELDEQEEERSRGTKRKLEAGPPLIISLIICPDLALFIETFC